MGEAYSMHGRDKNAYTSEERDHSEDLGIDGRTLNCNFGK
jgi:hypothetical protein